MSGKQFLAFDLGAESGRAVLGVLADGTLRLEEIHRFPNGPVRVLGSMHWDVLRLFQEMKDGLRAFRGGRRGELEGIACDTWGVDFALLGRGNMLLGIPCHYRDSRTIGMMAKVFERMPREEIYRLTGIQFMQINTLYHLYSMVLSGSPLLEAAERLVMMAGLFHLFLSGRAVAEFSLATTSQLYNPVEQDWAEPIFGTLNLPLDIMPEIVPPCTVIGELLPAIGAEVGVGKVPVIASACHDTAAAVAAVPAEGEDWAYISSGTWSLIGAEIPEARITDIGYEHNITNEGGVDGTFRFLNNNMGLWLLQECRRKWQREGDDLGYRELTKLAERSPAFGALVDPDDEGFLNPADMPAAIAVHCERTGQTPPPDRGAMVRCILESLALKYRVVLARQEQALEKKYRVIHIVGGGSQNRVLSQFAANATHLPVVTGPVEATAAGNVLMQAVARGVLGSVAEAREVVRRSFDVVTYEPGDADVWDAAYGRFQELVK